MRYLSIIVFGIVLTSCATKKAIPTRYRGMCNVWGGMGQFWPLPTSKYPRYTIWEVKDKTDNLWEKAHQIGPDASVLYLDCLGVLSPSKKYGYKLEVLKIYEIRWSKNKDVRANQ